MKKTIILILTVSILALMGCSVPDNAVMLDSWEIVEASNDSLRVPDVPESKWKKVAVPSTTPLDSYEKVFWIRSTFSGNFDRPGALKKGLSIYLGRIADTDHTFINGKMIGHTGSEPPSLYSSWSQHRAYNIPPEILKKDGENTIHIRIFADTVLALYHVPFIHNSEFIGKYLFFKNFQSWYIHIITGFIALVLGIISLVEHLSDRKRKLPLVFSILCGGWFVITLHMFLPQTPITYPDREIIYFMLLVAESVLIYLFMEELLGVRIKWLRIIVLVLGIAGILMTGSAFFFGKLYGIRKLGITLLMTLMQVSWALIIIRALASGNREARIVLVAYILFVSTVLMDALMIMHVYESEILWINFGYMVLLFTFSTTMAQRNTTMARDLAQSKSRIEDQNSMLSHVFEKVRWSVKTLTEFTSSVKGHTDAMQHSMNDQSASLEQTAASMEELQATSQSINDRIKEQDTIIHNNRELLKGYLDSINNITMAAKEAVQLSFNTMGMTENTKSSLQDIVDGMARIRESSDAIREISTMINDIAEQTNLLSLNASIEAARAGDSGMGFAVVAQEIGKLADRSIEQSKSIQNIINETVSYIENETDTVSRSSGNIEQVEKSVNSVGKAIDSILDLCIEQEGLTTKTKENIDRIAAGSQGITSATADQHNTISEISKSIEMLNEITQGVVSRSDNMAESLDTLMTQVDSLREIVESQAGNNNKDQ